MDTEHLLSEFGSTRHQAIAEYRKFIQEGIGIGQGAEFTGGGLLRSQGWSQVLAMRRRGQKEQYDERILGGADFVNKILKDAEERQLRQTKLRRSGRTIEKIIDEECNGRQISVKELKAGCKR
ncbi:MAG: hypothetical protein AABY87_09865 [bacterium]